METKKEIMIALQIVGSPTSHFFHQLSLLYAQDILCPPNFKLLYVIAYPDGKWSVTECLKKNAHKFSLEEMILAAKIGDIAVPHMFCETGLTSIRNLFEDILKIPIVGSPGHTLKITQNKNLSKLLVNNSGVRTPQGVIVKTYEDLSKLTKFEFPLIIKPNNADNSEGLTLAKNYVELKQGITLAGQYDREVLIEQYISGRELRGAIVEIDGAFDILPFIEYNVSEKYPIRHGSDKLKFDKDGELLNQSDKELISATCPAVINKSLLLELSKQMITAHQALGCRDYSMYDFRIDAITKKPYLLEAGLFWSFSEKSMISTMLKAGGINLEMITSKIWRKTFNRNIN